MIKRIMAIAVGLPLLVLWFNAAMHLLSVPDDGAVLCGYVLLGSWVTAIAFGAMRICSWLGISGKFHGIGILLLVCFLSSGCNTVVTPGHVGLLVKQTGTDRGVQDYPLQTGRVFYNPVNEDVLMWPTSVQRAIWTHNDKEGNAANEEISFQSKEGLHFAADVNLSYELLPQKVPHFYVKFRTDNLDQFTHGFLRDTVRNCLGQVSTDYTAEEINGAMQGVLASKVQDCITKFSEGFGVNVVQFGFAAPPRPPDQVKQAIESKIAAIQEAERVQNQLQSSIAEGKKTVALATAQAEANRITSASITPSLIQWAQLEVLKMKWNGQMPLSVGSNTLPLMNLGTNPK